MFADGANLLLLAGFALVAAACVRAGVTLRADRRRRAARRRRRFDELGAFADAVNDAVNRYYEESADAPAWEGWRPFRIDEKIREAPGVWSFRLAAADGEAVPDFRPGQYLRIRLDLPGEPRPVIRCYSLSDRPRDGRYRITVKRCPPPADQADAPPGRGSNRLIDALNAGDRIDVQAPVGRFTLSDSDRPVVFLVAGIGVTPVLGMLNQLADAENARPAHLFYGVRDASELIMLEELRRIAESRHDVRVHLCLSRTADAEASTRVRVHNERVSVELLRRTLPLDDYEFYVCGPDAMMDEMIRDLTTWGVPADRIITESFGPAPARRADDRRTDGAGVDVVFARSGCVAHWNPDSGTILDLARECGVELNAGCRSGHCGSCMTAVRSGRVQYDHAPGLRVRKGACLTCIARPETDIVIDA